MFVIIFFGGERGARKYIGGMWHRHCCLLYSLPLIYVLTLFSAKHYLSPKLWVIPPENINFLSKICNTTLKLLSLTSNFLHQYIRYCQTKIHLRSMPVLVKLQALGVFIRDNMVYSNILCHFN